MIWNSPPRFASRVILQSATLWLYQGIDLFLA
jgi:hypothetical protein